MKSNRLLKVEQQVQRFLAHLLIQNSLPESHDFKLDGLATITHVSVSPDLHNARIRIRHFDQNKNTKLVTYLNSVSHLIRKEFARKINARFTPNFVFVEDQNLEAENNIEALFQRVRQEHA